MRIVFRADASSVIGTGHVTRCLTLAQGLRELGAEIAFLCAPAEGDLCARIERDGFALRRIELPSGSGWQADAERSAAAVRERVGNADWLVVDHYGLDDRWERALRSCAVRVMAVDDLADRAHDCDLLLDQNLIEGLDRRYDGKLPAGCGRLLGPEYALLQPGYSELRKRTPPREGPVRRLLIYFGGADSGNFAGRTLSAFVKVRRPDVAVDIVVSEAHPSFNAIREMAAGARITVHTGLPTLAELMVRADLAVGASGATSWERLCLGLPSFVVSLAPNQRPIAEALDGRGLARWLGDSEAVDDAVLARALSEALDKDLDAEWSLRCSSVVDGKGCERVCAAMLVGRDTPLRARRACLSDEQRVLEWANDPTTRRNGFAPELIGAPTHRAWFRGRLRDVDGCRFFIVEAEGGAPVGQVRFERHEGAWEVHYAVAPIFRGRGLGRPLLEAALGQVWRETPGAAIFGRVRQGNEASQRIFEGLGFARAPKAEGIVEFRRER